MKQIAILLACVMLAGCTAMPTETIGTDTVKSPVAVSSENLSSAEIESKQMQSEEAVSSNAPHATQANSENKKQKTAEQILIETYKQSYGYEIAPTKAKPQKDPCLFAMDPKPSGGSIESKRQLDPAVQKAYLQVICAFTQNLQPTMGRITAQDTVQCYGEVDGYAVCYVDRRPTDQTRRAPTYNRLAGYQFLVAEITALNPSVVERAYDSQGNAKSGKVRDILYYSSVFLIRDDKCDFLENLYLDGTIGAKTVRKVYSLLPQALRCGYFERHPDVFMLSNFDVVKSDDGYSITIPEKDPMYARYYDRNGKFHVVVA